ncbi:hypothetical protein ACFWBH_12610 [Streptomyces sp. NPDC059999]|uniref:hypothetical protein n=1 Tax=Streptomyces sp. NPDC059999 TaxID=3347030 RepID=UPI0036CA2B39
MRLRTPAPARIPARPRAAAFAAVAALALAAVVPATAHADAPAAGRPGDIVTSAPSAFHPLPGQPTGTKAWKIQYRSTTALTQSLAAGNWLADRFAGRSTHANC